MIEVELPDGTIVEFPEGTPPEVMKGALQKKFGAPQQAAPSQPQVGVGEDMAKGFGAGVAQGAIGLPGTFGDVAQINSNLLSRGAEYLGAPQMVQDAAGMAGKALMGPLGFMPTSDQITKTVEGFTGPLYEAKTVPGQYAQTAGQFAPAALLGPGKVAQKAVPAMAGALLSETAGQATKDTAAEPYARLAGGLLGGAAVATPRRTALKQMREAAPSLEKVGAQTDAAYARLREAGIQFDPNSYRSFAMRVMNKLQKHGWRPRDGDPISSDIQEIQGLVGKPVNWDEAENLRQFVGNLPKTASNKDFARAAIIRDELDAFISHGKVISTKGLDPAIIGTLTKQARELGRRNILGKQINKMGDKSEWYLAGDESGLKNQVSSFGKREGRSLQPAESAALKKVIRKEGVNNLLSTTGGRLGQLVLGAAAFPTGGLLGTGAALGTHLVARKISEAKTQKAIKEALKTVLAGRAAQKKALLNPRLAIQGNVGRFGLLGAASQSGN